ncbi:MAG: hypothetical protein Q4F69_09840 [Bacteroidia bacterium]|nr:hypothetical protein [Bacteroidia bacterium]
MKINSKKIKFPATLIVAVLIAGIVIFQACKKVNTQTPKPMENEEGRIPLAIYDHQNGIMTSLIDVEALNFKLKNSMVQKGDEDRFIIESVTISDDKPHGSEVSQEIRIVLLDTEAETPITIWLMYYFTDKIVRETNTSYYVNGDVENGNYEFAYYDTNGDLYACHVNGNGYSVSKKNPLEYSPLKPKMGILCTRLGQCEHECHKVGSGDSLTCECVGGGACMSIVAPEVIILIAELFL